MSDTPRTDKFAQTPTDRAPGQELLLIGDWVEFSRQIERELAAAQAELAIADQSLDVQKREIEYWKAEHLKYTNQPKGKPMTDDWIKELAHKPQFWDKQVGFLVVEFARAIEQAVLAARHASDAPRESVRHK